MNIFLEGTFQQLIPHEIILVSKAEEGDDCLILKVFLWGS